LEADPDSRYPLTCDLKDLAGLGPGVPLYFKFLRHIIITLAICTIPYIWLMASYATSPDKALEGWCTKPAPNCNPSWWMHTAAARGPLQRLHVHEHVPQHTQQHENQTNCGMAGGKACEQMPVQCIDALPPNSTGMSMLDMWRTNFPKLGQPKDTEVLGVSFLASMIFLISVPLLRRAITVKNEEFAGNAVSEHHYTVEIRGLPATLQDFDEKRLMRFFKDALDAKYDTSGQLTHKAVHVTAVFNLGKMFKYLNKERSMYKLAQRLNVITADLSELRDEAQGYKRYFLDRRTRKAEDQFDKAMSKRSEFLKLLAAENKSLKVVGALITFEHTIAAARAIELFTPSLLPKCVVPNLHQKFKGSYVSCHWPREPADIVWSNLGKNIVVVFFYRALGRLAMILPVVVASYAIYELTRIKKAGHDEADLSAAEIVDEETVSLLAGPAVLLLDVFVRQVLFKVAKLQRHGSKDKADASTMWKLTVASIINSAICCLIVHVEIDSDVAGSSEKNWYLKGALLPDALAICITNMIVTPLLNLFSSWGFKIYLKRLLVNPLSSKITQEHLVHLYSGPEYRIAYRYAGVFKTLFLTLFYAPLAPAFILPIGLCTLILQYWADKICLLRLATRPPWQNDHLVKKAAQLLPLVIVLIPLTSVFLMRGTVYTNLWNWMRPCFGLALPFGHASIWRTLNLQTPDQSTSTFLTQIYVWVPIVVCLTVTFGRGGHKLLVKMPLWGGRCFAETLKKVCRCVARTMVIVVTCGIIGWKIEEKGSTEEEEEGEHVNYYQVQRQLRSKYRLLNPVYLTLDQKKQNPKRLPLPDDYEGPEQSRSLDDDGTVSGSISFPADSITMHSVRSSTQTSRTTRCGSVGTIAYADSADVVGTFDGKPLRVALKKLASTPHRISGIYSGDNFPLASTHRQSHQQDTRKTLRTSLKPNAQAQAQALDYTTGISFDCGGAGADIEMEGKPAQSKGGTKAPRKSAVQFADVTESFDIEATASLDVERERTETGISEWSTCE